MDDFGTILFTRGWPPAKSSGLRGRFSTASLPCHCGLEGFSPYHEERRKATIFQKVATALANPSSAGPIAAEKCQIRRPTSPPPPGPSFASRNRALADAELSNLDLG